MPSESSVSPENVSELPATVQQTGSLPEACSPRPPPAIASSPVKLGTLHNPLGEQNEHPQGRQPGCSPHGHLRRQQLQQLQSQDQPVSAQQQQTLTSAKLPAPAPAALSISLGRPTAGGAACALVMPLPPHEVLTVAGPGAAELPGNTAVSPEQPAHMSRHPGEAVTDDARQQQSAAQPAAQPGPISGSAAGPSLTGRCAAPQACGADTGTPGHALSDAASRDARELQTTHPVTAECSQPQAPSNSQVQVRRYDSAKTCKTGHCIFCIQLTGTSHLYTSWDQLTGLRQPANTSILPWTQ